MGRAIELVLAAILVVVSLPLTLPILIALLIASPGNPFFSQTRIGHLGEPFNLLKFRTMCPGAGGSSLTVGDDGRVTAIGRFLRRFKLDEIPQLWNILCGQMSFIGPRPETEEFVRGYTTEQRQILRYKPGLTDPASLKYRYEAELLGSETDPQAAYRERILPDKIAVSLEYQRRRTLASDLLILGKTVIAVFQSDSALTR
ncbi:MAG: sugar transferase [bacterium]